MVNRQMADHPPPALLALPPPRSSDILPLQQGQKCVSAPGAGQGQKPTVPNFPAPGSRPAPASSASSWPCSSASIPLHNAPLVRTSTSPAQNPTDLHTEDRVWTRGWGGGQQGAVGSNRVGEMAEDRPQCSRLKKKIEKKNKIKSYMEREAISSPISVPSLSYSRHLVPPAPMTMVALAREHAHLLVAYSLLKARPMTIRRISDVPAPISYSLAL